MSVESEERRFKLESPTDGNGMRKIWLGVAIGFITIFLVFVPAAYYSGLSQSGLRFEKVTTTHTVTSITTATAPPITVTQTITQQATAAQTTSPTTTAPPEGGALQVRVSVAKSVITRGSIQTIQITITSDGKGVEGASISGVITYTSGFQHSFSGVTTSEGAYSYSWQIGGNSTPGTFTISATASKSGYTSGQGSTSFSVTTASG